MNVGFGLCARDRRAHRIAIVFADEQNRQIPKAGEVERFMELTFRHGAFTEETGSDIALALHGVGQRQPTGEWQAATNNRIATIKVGRLVEKMHRPAAAARAAFGLAIHLRHHGRHGYASHERMAMLAVCRDNAIICAQNRDDA